MRLIRTGPPATASQHASPLLLRPQPCAGRATATPTIARAQLTRKERLRVTAAAAADDDRKCRAKRRPKEGSEERGSGRAAVGRGVCVWLGGCWGGGVN